MDAMTVWQQNRYGGPEQLVRSEVTVPTPAAGEVVVRVRATGLNAADVRLMRGEPLLVRAFFGLRRPRERVRGMDVAGTVVAVGEASGEAGAVGEASGEAGAVGEAGTVGEATGAADLDSEAFAVGDEVVGELPGGGLAEYAVASVERLVRLPAGVDPVQAAAVPMAGGTAWQALAAARLQRGQRALVIGASGGVGTFTVQLAADRGAEVWALCGERSRALVQALGAVHVFDYRRVQPGSPELPEAGFDAVIDIAGTAPLGAIRRLLRRGGCLVSVAGGERRVVGPIPRLLWGALSWIGSKRRFAPLAASAKTEVTAELLRLVASGRITPVIERTWPLAQAPEALAHVDSRRTVGKVVVLPACAPFVDALPLIAPASLAMRTFPIETLRGSRRAISVRQRLMKDNRGMAVVTPTGTGVVIAPGCAGERT